ncbi:MAG: 3-phosphoserine/phosphohydroxythreonine transaminase [Sedimentisphaerales bacterium]|nr:3-phosphoserine/phosphohydroxythreonine transaminase [Sedimentisphaerales bacterium]
MPRVHNFYAGPAALPLEALEAAREELLDFRGSGVSVMETSHRSKEYDAVHNEAGQLFSELLGLGDNFKVLFLQGGASLQFAMIPMNLLSPDQSADYIITGAWSQKALKEAKLFGTARVAATTEVDGVFNSIPTADQLDLDSNAQYCHLTSNNTIFGTQWRTFPDTGNVPLVADMSSDILSRSFDPSLFGIIYAGAQKNIGPAGVAVVAIRDDVLEKCKKDGVPTMLSYHTHADKNSLFNTPPCFTIYMVNKVFNWLKNKGGVATIEKENAAKADLIYGCIDNSNGYYTCPVAPQSRSWMNVVFRLPSEDLEKKFVAEGLAAGFVGLKGHRSVGGIRVSIYNANGLDSVKDVVNFMTNFVAKNG